MLVLPTLLATTSMLTMTPRWPSAGMLTNAPRWAFGTRANGGALFRSGLARMQSTAASTAASAPASFEELPTDGIFDKFELVKTEEVAERGLVAKVGRRQKTDGAKTIDLGGAILCPGFFDMHVHLREPGQEW